MELAHTIDAGLEGADLQTVFPPLYAAAAGARSTHHRLPGRFVLPHDRRAAAAVLSLFLDGPKAALLRSLNLVAAPLGFARGLVETDDLKEIRRELQYDGDLSALRRGTPGPYSKDCIAWMAGTEITSISKVAATAAANPRVVNGYRWLLTAQSFPALRARVPMPLSLRTVNGRAVLTLKTVNGHCSSNRLSSSHIALLQAIQRSGPSFVGFAGSQMQLWLRGSLQEVRSLIPLEHFRLCAGALEQLEAGLPRSLPMVSAHRDFAVWNIRENECGLTLLDWEYAAEQYVPLYDVFHFLCMPIAVSRRFTRRDVNCILHQARLAQSRLDADEFSGAESLQLLAYLLDRTLLHIVSRKGLEPGDKVMDAYFELLRDHDQWSRS